MQVRKQLTYSKYEWEATVAWAASSLVLITLVIGAIVSTSLFVMEFSALLLDGCCPESVSLTILLMAYVAVLGIWLVFRRMSIQTHPIRLIPLDSKADLTELGLALGLTAVLCVAAISLAALPAWEIPFLFVAASIPLTMIAIPTWKTISRVMAAAVPATAIYIALTAPLSIAGAFLLVAPLCALLFIGWTRQAKIETIEETLRQTELRVTTLHRRLAAQKKTLRKLHIPQIAIEDVPTSAISEPKNIRALRLMTSIPVRIMLLAAITGSGAAMFTVVLDYIVLSPEVTSALAPLGFGASTSNDTVRPLAATVGSGHWYITTAWAFALLVWLLLSFEGANEGRQALNRLRHLTALAQKLSARADYQAKKIEAVKASSKRRVSATAAPKLKVPNHYHTLGIKKDAGIKEIRDAYRQLAKKYHPDKTGSAGESRMKQINEAYKILSDTQARIRYDSGHHLS